MKTRLLPLILILLTACGPKIDFQVKKQVVTGLADTVSVVAAGNLVGNSKDELVLGTDSTVYIYNASDSSAELLYSAVLSDEVLLLSVGDVDNDGENELVAVTGRIRYQKTDVKVYLIDQEEGKWNTKEIYSKFSTRPHATSLTIASYPDPEQPSILVSYFESKYLVETVAISLENDEWTAEVLWLKRMAMAMDVGDFYDDLSGENLLKMAVGRVYGDDIGMTGDAYFFGPENEFLPAKRGVKAVKFGDGDNDGKNELYLGDGWHQDYGKIARGRLAVVNTSNSDLTYELIEDVKYQYEITQIEIEDLNRDGLNEVITKGNKYIRIYQKEKEGDWTVYTDTLLPVKQFCVGDVTGDKHPEVIFAGAKVKIFNLGNLDFSSDLGKEVMTEKVMPDSLIGNPAPELSMEQWFNDSFPGLYNSKGKVILLDFWATWCKPCIKTFPEMERFQNTYGSDGLQILGITRLDNRQDKIAIKEFIDKQNFVYPIGLSTESLNNLSYGVGGIPHVVLIDKKGIVRWHKVGSGDTSEMEKMIKALISE